MPGDYTEITIYSVEDSSDFTESKKFVLSNNSFLGSKYYSPDNHPYILWENKLFFFIYGYQEYDCIEYDLINKSDITHYTFKNDMIAGAYISDIQFVGPTVKKYDSKEQLMAQ